MTTLVALVTAGLTMLAQPSHIVDAPRPDPEVRAHRYAIASYAVAPWPALAECESDGDPTAVSPGGTYRGLYQFDYPTWRSVGGTGDPAAAPPDVQTEMARRLQARRGWAPWPACSSRLGLRP